MGTGSSLVYSDEAKKKSAKARLLLDILQDPEAYNINNRCIDVLFICDEWGSSKGGLSTFNREFAGNFARVSSDTIKVHCYVCNSSEEDREDAKKQEVNLITARRVPGTNDPLEWLKIPPPELPYPHVVVGHGRKFGVAALHIANRAQSWWIQFVHVFCEDLGKHKLEASATSDAIADYELKHQLELELCKEAATVVAVGSQLQRKYNRCLPDIEVEVITPGIFEEFRELDVSQPAEAKEFKIFMFGRGSFEDFELKGYDIIGEAVALLGREFELTYVGSPEDKHRTIENWFREKSEILRNKLTIRGYCEYKEIKNMFLEADLIVMPSRSEGFGLVALEAISAGIPVLVSSEAGIAEALMNLSREGMSVVINSDLPEDWAEKIYGLSRLKPSERLANAKCLREDYEMKYSWSRECERFETMIRTLMENVQGKAVPLNISSTVRGTFMNLKGFISFWDEETLMDKEEVPLKDESTAASQLFSSEYTQEDDFATDESTAASQSLSEDTQEDYFTTDERIPNSQSLSEYTQEDDFTTGITLPQHWTPMPYPNMSVLLVRLSESSTEYQDVVRQIEATTSEVKIQKIERIQNPLLYQSYMFRKQRMDKTIGRNSERQLFHGTAAGNVTFINTQGFNRSFCGTHGTRYGRGVYFARDASYAVRYTGGGGGGGCIYLARVLVGHFCTGDVSMVVPPPKNPCRPEILFDSVVDNPANPYIYVVFFDNQCYPEYLITIQ